VTDLKGAAATTGQPEDLHAAAMTLSLRGKALQFHETHAKQSQG
jgi:hypothetical protein